MEPSQGEKLQPHEFMSIARQDRTFSMLHEKWLEAELCMCQLLMAGPISKDFETEHIHWLGQNHTSTGEAFHVQEYRAT